MLSLALESNSESSSPTLEELQAQWYARLEAEGFKDIEDTQRKTRELHIWHSFHFQKTHTPESFDAKAEYFRAVGRYVESLAELPPPLRFCYGRRREILERHGRGDTVRHIAKELHLTTYRVFKTIQELSQILREWADEQD